MPAAIVRIEHAGAERVKVLEMDALVRFVTVTVTATAVPAGMQEGDVHTSSLVVSVLEGTSIVPVLAVHEKWSGDDASSLAVT
jgi:hypothetical protein